MLRIWRCDCALCVIGNEFPCRQPHNPSATLSRGLTTFFMFLFQSPSISPLSQRQPIITMITGCPSYPRRESNPDLRFRKPSFYPLNYGGIA